MGTAVNKLISFDINTRQVQLKVFSHQGLRIHQGLKADIWD